MKRSIAVVAVGVLANASLAAAEIITVLYEGRAGTVAQKPFGLTVPLDTPINGYFTFDTNTPDENPANEYRGEYQHDGNAAFLAEFLGTRITGSNTPFYEVQLLQSNATIDTFRVYDGPAPVGNEGGEMSINGTEDPDIQLWFSATEDVFDDDGLIDPFPLYDFSQFGTSYTFSLEDDQGTILLRLSKATEAVCGDMNGGGVSASDALGVLRTAVGSQECLPCICDADGNGTIAAPDALTTLRFSVGASVSLECSVCL
jgi:hypothetical protein